MDRFLTEAVDKAEKDLLLPKIIKLVDIYYMALDASKSGDQVNIILELVKLLFFQCFYVASHFVWFADFVFDPVWS